MLEYAVKIGMERDFLYRSEKGRYRINPSYHNLVINYLIERNLLYADR
jgi:hypothetical protein